MEAPCLAHKFERPLNTVDGPRPEIRPNLLHEGEVSPYKICITILLREQYSLQTPKNSDRTDKEVFKSLLCLYDLTRCPDISFAELKRVLQDPANSFRIEVVQSFLNIILELDRNNPGFLDDFTGTMMEAIEGTNAVTLLKKKIGKNSPFGKYVKLVLTNLKKMNYAQTIHAYRELCLYVGLVYNMSTDKEVPIRRRSGVAKAGSSKNTVDVQETITMEQGETTATIITQTQSTTETSALEQAISDTQIDDEDVELDILSDDEQLPAVGIQETHGLGTTASRNASPLLDTVDFQSSSTNIAAEVEVKTMLSTPASITKPIGFIFDKMLKMVPYDPAFAFNSQTLTAPVPNKDSTPKPGLDVFEQMRRARIENNLHGLGPNLASNFGQRLEIMRTIKPPSKSRKEKKRLNKTLTSKNSSRSEPAAAAAMDVDEVSPESENRQKYSSSVTGDNKAAASTNPKWWNRKLIEQTIKIIARDFNSNLLPREYSSKDVSLFVAKAKDSPCAKAVLPQLHFVESLNGADIKDISRANEALRTSFDYRIKPTTSELSKVIPYASYKLAVMNDRFGYESDARIFLEEAFQSAHNAGDETCLDHCHHLWAKFEGVPSRVLLTGKDGIGKSVGHLYTSKAISTIFNKIEKGGFTSQLSLINEILHCVPDGIDAGETKDGEALQIEALSSVLMTFGWFQFAKLNFFITINLSSTFNWTNASYCCALCSLAQLYLLEGNVQFACELIDGGRNLFEKETSALGEMFNFEFSLFQALAASLAYVPLSDDLLATIAAFDPVESLYWLAHNKIMGNDFDNGCLVMKKLLQDLNASKNPRPELRLRCCLLLGELYCLTNNPTSALPYLDEALELATKSHADYYIVLSVIALASVQHRLGLINIASRTIHTYLENLVRCDALLPRAKFNVLSVKLFLSMEASDPLQLQTEDDFNPGVNHERDEFTNFFMSLSPRLRRGVGRRNSSSKRKKPSSASIAEELQEYKTKAKDVLLDMLEKSEEIYEQWSNSYRLKEIYYLKKLVWEYGQTELDQVEEIQNELDGIETHLIWNPKTCVI